MVCARKETCGTETLIYEGGWVWYAKSKDIDHESFDEWAIDKHTSSAQTRLVRLSALFQTRLGADPVTPK